MELVETNLSFQADDPLPPALQTLTKSNRIQQLNLGPLFEGLLMLIYYTMYIYIYLLVCLNRKYATLKHVVTPLRKELWHIKFIYYKIK